jgi:hypothetical protein
MPPVLHRLGMSDAVLRRFGGDLQAPQVLAAGLTESDARRLADALRREGLTTEIISGGIRGHLRLVDRYARQFGLLGFTLFAGATQTVNLLTVDSLATGQLVRLLATSLGAALIVVLPLLWWISRNYIARMFDPLVEFRATSALETDGELLALPAPVADALDTIETRRLRRLLTRLLEQAATTARTAERADADRNQLDQRIDVILAEAAQIAESVSEADRLCQTADPRQLRERIDRLSRAIEQTDEADRLEALIDQKSRVVQRLEALTEAEVELDRAVARLLEASDELRAMNQRLQAQTTPRLPS